MPELPDVEGFRRTLNDHGIGKVIRHIEVRDRQSVRNTTPAHFAQVLEGRSFRAPERRGKWLLARTDGPAVLLHFGMTGGLEWETNGRDRHRHDRVIFGFDDGELRFHDMRKLQGIWLAADGDAISRVIGEQGPDALTITRRQFEERLGAHRGQLKPVLMDQRIIAGLGNLLSDEILWRARIHPARQANSLSPEEHSRLFRAMRKVVHESSRVGFVPGKHHWLTGARPPQGNGRCPRDGVALRHETIGGRTTYYCPRDQPAPRDSRRRVISSAAMRRARP